MTRFVEIPRVSIRDMDALERLSFAMVEDYVKNTGWRFCGIEGDEQIRIAIYDRTGPKVEEIFRQPRVELDIGRNEAFGDRPLRIREVIEIVAKMECRSELDVYWDIISLAAPEGWRRPVPPACGD